MFKSFAMSVCVFFILWVPNNAYVLQEMSDNNLNNKDIGDWSVDFNIDDDDYEMVDYKQILTEHPQSLGKSNKKTYKIWKSSGVNTKLVKGKRSRAKNIDAYKDKSATSQTVAKLSSLHLISKREVTTESGAHQIPCVKKESLIYRCSNPHCDMETRKNEAFKILESIKQFFIFNMTINCTTEDASGIGIRAIRCLFADYHQNRQHYSMLMARLWRITVIWLIVYLVVAIPLWCTKGWCCCCLYCKFFKPQETIQEAKNYLLLNPPGVLVTKKGAIIHYEPTEREKDCYEEIGHFIRTL